MSHATALCRRVKASCAVILGITETQVTLVALRRTNAAWYLVPAAPAGLRGYQLPYTTRRHRTILHRLAVQQVVLPCLDDAVRLTRHLFGKSSQYVKFVDSLLCICIIRLRRFSSCSVVL